ncbi:hypothetical protein [Pleomorphovibrio marinus]|uniref:hypothetical protein n=1 Tax=Pleomorphovibrio marinus TaxID=2164132 RepID=UPI001E5EB8C0|nr:hypothetical protein [Pleomorphovibrio marinus]
MEDEVDKETEDPLVPETEKVLKVGTLTVDSSPDASLELYRPLGNEQFEPGKVPFEFNIKNYRFGKENPISMVVNSGNPVSYSQAIFSKEFNTGTYRAVAFLTDRRGLALKEYGNYVDRDFLVGNSRPIPAGDEPYIMLNLPRDGQELAKDEQLIVDFLVIGGEMEADQLEIEIEIGDFKHKTSQMETLTIEGLNEGEHVLYVHLLRKDGKSLVNIFSSVRRLVIVK